MVGDYDYTVSLGEVGKVHVTHEPEYTAYRLEFLAVEVAPLPLRELELSLRTALAWVLAVQNPYQRVQFEARQDRLRKESRLREYVDSALEQARAQPEFGETAFLLVLAGLRDD